MNALECDGEEARRAVQEFGARLIDVRESHELQAHGAISGADHWPCSLGLPKCEGDRRVILVCASGQRSLRVATQLRQRGIDASSLRGGASAWWAQSIAEPAADPRYARHHLLAGVGLEGQRRLARARVAIVGAGGLGSPAAFYLAAAGVGFLRLIDDDRVERSNLQRQILHTDAGVGQLKVASARERLTALNPQVEVECVPQRLRADNIDTLLADVDLVLDGSDNFATRYLVDSRCRALAKPWVYGAVQRFDGQVSLFAAQRRDAPCYRCLFPDPPAAGEAPNCAEAGVLGVLPGLIGSLQATEALKFLLGLGDALVGRLLLVDALGMRFREIGFGRDPQCPGCGVEHEKLPEAPQICAL